MSLTVSSNGGSFEEIEAGSYAGRCIRLIDLGTQEGEYQGKKTLKAQILIMWEIPELLIEEGEYEGKPRTISKFYTASTDEKANLRKDLQVWRGRPFTEDEIEAFNLLSILGVPCLLSVSHKANGKAAVTGVGKLPKGMTCPPQVLPSVAFDLDLWIKGDPEQAKTYAALSDGIRGMIDRSQEVKAHLKGDSGGSSYTDDPTSEIPF